MRHRATVALLLLLTPATVRSDWAWRYPQPQGHTLNDVVFLTNTDAIAVGQYGTVLITHDTGETWSVSSFVEGIQTALVRVDRLDATSAVAVGHGGVVLRTTDGGEHWTSIASGTSSDLLDVSFGDASHGIVVAGSQVLRTSNGGLSWDMMTVPDFLRAVDAVTASDAFAVGDGTTVLVTSDGGANWTPKPKPLSPPSSAPLTSVDFIDGLHGVVGARTGDDGGVAMQSALHVTDDGGSTWTPLYPFNGDWEDYTPNEIAHPGIGQTFVAYTMRCCQLSAYDPWPWGELVVGNAPFTHAGTTHSANGLARNDDGVVIVVGEDGLIMRRETDGTIVRVGGVRHYHQIGGAASSFADPWTGIVMSSDDYMFPSGLTGYPDTHFARTTDGGHTWAHVKIQTFECLDLAHLSASDIYATGLDIGGKGTMMRSTDGGATWSFVYSNVSLFPGAIAAGSPTHAVAVGSGRAFVVDNGAITVVVTPGGFRDVAFASPLVVVGVSTGSINGRSTDGGLTWSSLPAPSPRVVSLDFATPTIAFGVTPNGISRSDDVGSTWTPVPSAVYANLRHIDFADANHGVAVGDDAVVLLTSDGGVTWLPEVSPTGRDFNDATAFSAGVAFVSGQQQTLLEYFLQPVPTLISSFDVEAHPFAAELRWSVRDEGDLTSFTIHRRADAGDAAVAIDVARGARSYHDDGLVPGQRYEYQLVAVDQDGAIASSAPIAVTIPRATLELLPNQPNPFNPSTRIGFVVPAKQHVRLEVFDAAGRRVSTLVNEARDAGVHSVEWNAIGAASGVYFCRLRAGKDSVSRKMVLIK